MTKASAGILLFRKAQDGAEVLLVHPGGPFWARKDDGAWSIPKGELEPDEDPVTAARRELKEETGLDPHGQLLPLGTVRQRGGKVVHAWAIRGDFDPGALRSNRFSIEWPPGSGRQKEFPEVDRAGWFSIRAAERKILSGQAPLLQRLREALRRPASPRGRVDAVAPRNRAAGPRSS